MDYEHEYQPLDDMSAMTDRRVKRNTLSLSEEFGAMEKTDEGGAHFQTTFGLVLSCMGCVVGTGNIWRFPRIVAQNSSEEGGLVFLLVWLLFLFLWSSPLLMLEYGTGRYTKKAILGSLRQFLGDNHIWCGAWISLVTFAISCYYSVVLGWCFYYFVYYIGHELPNDDEKSKEIFHEFAEDSYWPILTHFCAVFLAAVGVSRGVKTIEKVSMVLVPLLLLILLFTFIWSLTREYTEKGLKFLFTPHWESFKEPRLWVDAASQNAFDTGAGMGLMIPYSAYMTRRNGIVKYANIVPATNNFVSLLCGMTIFGTTFSTLMTGQSPRNETEIINIMKESGPASTGLTFIWMPVLFETIGTLGRVIAVLFFLCLSFAGVTSLMSNFELTTKTFEDFGLKRRFGMPLAVLLTFSVGLASALDIDVLTNQDFVWGFALIVSGLILMYMVLKYGIRTFRETVVNNYSENDWKLTFVWEFIIKFVTPVEAVALIAWWAIDLITSDAGDGEEWYTFGKETLIMTLTQWLSMMLILIILNIVYVKCRRNPIYYEEFRDHEKTPLLLSQNSDGDLSRDLDGSFKELRL